MISSLYLVRHAEAGDRERWDGPDELRPLTPEGVEHAEALVPRFAAMGLARLVSSPFLRCIQTLEPLAADRDLPIEPAEDLAEGTPPERALALIAGLSEAPAALCSHGDVIESTIGALLAAGTPHDGPVGFAKGSVWELHTQRGAVVRLRYLPPPD
jgi:broad specificity phosphatase PhoE